MAGLTSIPVAPASTIDVPGGTNAVLFIDSADNKLKIKNSTGDVLVGKVVGSEIVFE